MLMSVKIKVRVKFEAGSFVHNVALELNTWNLTAVMSMNRFNLSTTRATGHRHGDGGAKIRAFSS